MNVVGYFIKDLPNEEITRLGITLGLNYVRLCNMTSQPNYYLDVVNSWLRQEDNVEDTSGEPSWETLAWALREIGQNGIRQKIIDARGRKSDIHNVT